MSNEFNKTAISILLFVIAILLFFNLLKIEEYDKEIFIKYKSSIDGICQNMEQTYDYDLPNLDNCICNKYTNKEMLEEYYVCGQNAQCQCLKIVKRHKIVWK